MILKVSDLTKEYQQGDKIVSALKNVNFELPESQTLAIVGPSGSGKTTLLSLIAGLDRPSRGSVTLAGAQLNAMTERELSLHRARTVGIVFQQFHLMPHLTAHENVNLPLEILGREGSNDQALKALQDVGLDHRLNHLPNQLSGGECQRVAIARASVVEPKILLADEPSGNLDKDSAKNVIDLLFGLVEEKGMTLVLVTHDFHLAERCSERIQISGGQIQ